MATSREHIYAILNIYNAGPSSDDSIIPEPLVLHYMNVTRSLLLKRKADKGALSDRNKQSFCLDLVPSKFFDCSCIMPEHNCIILRARQPLPEYLSTKDKALIEVRLLDGTVLNQTSYTTLKKASFSRTGENKISWFIFNSFLYVVGSLKLEKIVVSGVFDDPLSVSKFVNCEEGGSCYDDLSAYPIEPDLIHPMYTMVLDMIIPTKNLPQDDENNARNSTIVQDEE